jgi:hypothetical protein
VQQVTERRPCRPGREAQDAQEQDPHEDPHEQTEVASPLLLDSLGHGQGAAHWGLRRNAAGRFMGFHG